MGNFVLDNQIVTVDSEKMLKQISEETNALLARIGEFHERIKDLQESIRDSK